MTGRKQERTVQMAVEEQCASLRTLSAAMLNHAGSLGWLSRSEAKLVRGYAEILLETAHALTAAVAEKEHTVLSRVWGGAKAVVIPLAFVAGSGADGLSLWDHLAAEPTVAHPAREVIERCDLSAGLIQSWHARAQVRSELLAHLDSLSDHLGRGALADNAFVSSGWAPEVRVAATELARAKADDTAVRDAIARGNVDEIVRVLGDLLPPALQSLTDAGVVGNAS